LFFEPSVALFVLLALLTAVLTAVYEPAFNALAVELVKPESFFRLNSLLAASHQVGLLSGAAAGGLLIELGVDWVMQGSAVCLGVAALCTLSLRKPAANAPTPSSDESETSIVAACLYVRRHLVLASILCAFLLLMSTLRTINTLLVPFCRDSLEACS